MEKAPDAFRTISEVSTWLDTPTHVLRFWESRFPQVAPVKRAGGRRYYRVEDMRLLGGIKKLLRDDGVSIKDLQDRLQQEGVEAVAALSPPLDGDGDGDGDTVGAPDGSADPLASPQQDAGELAETTPDPAPANQPELFRHRSTRPAEAKGGILQEDLPETPASPAGSPDDVIEDAPAQVSFRRHPKRTLKETAKDPVKAKPDSAQPSRTGLFVYDDSELADDRPPTPLETSAQPPEDLSRPTLDPIAHLPPDPEDNCPAPEPLPVTAEIRALALRVPGRLPAEAENAVTRIRSLYDRLA